MHQGNLVVCKDSHCILLHSTTLSTTCGAPASHPDLCLNCHLRLSLHLQRKSTLLVEYKQLRKSNAFLDRRIGGMTRPGWLQALTPPLKPSLAPLWLPGKLHLSISIGLCIACFTQPRKPQCPNLQDYMSCLMHFKDIKHVAEVVPLQRMRRG